MPNFKTFLTAGIFLSAGTLVHAVTAGWDVDPLGNHTDSTVQFALWDAFTQTQVGATSNYTFNGVSDLTSTLTGLSLSQNAAHALGVQGSGLLNSGDVYYSSTAPQSWTLNATASIDISTISFQIKTANVNTAVQDQLFVPTLNGVTAGVFYAGSLAGDAPLFGNATYMIEYRWSNLDIDAGTPLAITFSMAGGSSGNFTRKPVDFVSLDVSSVPEPGTAVLVGIAAIGLSAVRRRRSA